LLSDTVVTTVTSPDPDRLSTWVASLPSSPAGSITRTWPSTTATMAPGVCETTRPSLIPFARPCASTTSPPSAPIETTAKRSGGGAVRAGAIESPRRTLDCWPGPTLMVVVCPSRRGSGALCETFPSLVVTVVSGSPPTITTSTWNAVPRTEAVAEGVRTWYFDAPLRILVTTCQERPRFWVIPTTVAPSGSVERAVTDRELPGSISTVEPSKYVSTARPSAPVSMESPGPMTSPSTAWATGPLRW